ncbi:MAG: phosphoribosylaminoimidazolesuccinocarboxamide synthase [Pseudomonadales bacterium]
MFPVLHIGSVKNILGVEGQSPYLFHFSDRFSVFDWGAMPDELTDKGKALAIMADFFFRQMEGAETWQRLALPEDLAACQTYQEYRSKGLSHHSLGLCDASGGAVDEATPYLKVEPVAVPKLPFESGKYDYQAYAGQPLKTLIPLEVIFRFGVPEGSSLLKRTSDQAYCRTIGLATAPQPGERFVRPIIEYSTKLEASDRYISYAEAQQISGMSDVEFKRLHETVQLLALHLKTIFEKCQVELWDGKFEFAFAPEASSDGSRSLWLVDSIGPDELRLTYHGVQLSKENLRRFYRDSEWHKAIDLAKHLAADRGVKEWKPICEAELNSRPEPLSPQVKEATEMMYKTIANELVKACGERECFPGAWDFDTLIHKM